MLPRIDPSTANLVNLEAERAVIGRLLIDDRLWWDIADKIKPSDFGHPSLGNAFQAMIVLMGAGRSISTSAVLAQIGEEKKIDAVSASSYLHGLLAAASKPEITKVPIQEFVDIILHRSGCRQLLAAAEKIRTAASTASLDVSLEDLRHSASKALADSDATDSTDDDKLGDLASAVILSAEEARKSGKRVGIRTGFEPFDELVGSLLPGNLIVLAGETGSGKTALATQLGIFMAEQGIPGRMTSLEMEGRELATRVLSTYSAVQSENIVDGTVSAEDLDRMMDAGQRVFDLPFWIDGKPGQGVGTIQARLARAKAKYGIKYAIIDHLQYVKSDLTRVDERQQITQVVDDLKRVAKRLQIVIVLISHVSRQVDFSTISTIADIRRPSLNSLFGSSAIEKAADAVVFVHRPHWFLVRATPSEKKIDKHAADLLAWEGLAELVLPKRRGGAGFGTRKVFFNEELTWFSEKRVPNLKDEQLELLT